MRRCSPMSGSSATSRSSDWAGHRKGRGTRARTSGRDGGECGQATVEAAFLIPIIALLVLMLSQPTVILYDRMVMGSAAAEACRLLQTATGDTADAAAKAYTERRLGAIPPIDTFHVHEPCSWEIATTGQEGSEYVTARIANKVRPLPLMSPLAMGFGDMGSDGLLTIEVEVTQRARASWVTGMPSSWISQWE